MDIKNLTLEDMCRTCMKQFHQIQKKSVNHNKFHSIYEVPAGCHTNASFMEILKLLEPSIKISSEDDLPKILCSRCIAKLLNAYEFIETYKEVDKKFRKLLKELDMASSNDHSVEVIDDIDDEMDIHETTKVEFEIEGVKNDNFVHEVVVENDKEKDWPENEDELSNEISEVFNKTDACFIEAYNANSNKKCIPSKMCQTKSRRQKMNTEETTYIEIDSNGDRVTRAVLKSKDKNEDKIGLPPQNEDGSMSCQECDEILENVAVWQQHMRQHRLGKIPKIKYKRKSNSTKASKTSKIGYECEHCGKVFPRNAAYKNHLRIHTGEEPYLCIECGKSFKVVSSLNTHMLRHKGEKTYQCPHCPKKFVCSSGLYGHMMVHSKEKPYVCDICGSAFHMAYQLRNHNLYHSGTKKFQCEYCDMRFVTSEKQRRHMRTHTGEKPYRCKYCERAFAQSNDCIKHLRQHLGDNVYQCELCPLRFPMARDMKAHFATHKDDDEETRVRNLQARLEEERNLRIKLGVQES